MPYHTPTPIKTNLISFQTQRVYQASLLKPIALLWVLHARKKGWLSPAEVSLHLQHKSVNSGSFVEIKLSSTTGITP